MAQPAADQCHCSVHAAAVRARGHCTCTLDRGCAAFEGNIATALRCNLVCSVFHRPLQFQLTIPGCLYVHRSWDTSSQPTPSYPQQSLNVIAALVQRYSAAPALLGFGLLNEPTVRLPSGPVPVRQSDGAHSSVIVLSGSAYTRMCPSPPARQHNNCRSGCLVWRHAHLCAPAASCQWIMQQWAPAAKESSSTAFPYD